MTRCTTRNSLLGLLSVLALGACRKKPETTPAPAPTTVEVADGSASRGRADSLAAAASRRRADSLAIARGASGTDADGPRAQQMMKQTLVQVIYFDYDRDVLRDDARAILDAKAAILVANPALALVVVGHTDEQGTAEYNLALGQRRAAQVKRYLVTKGVEEGRLSTQSLGDSQPAVQGGDESSYQKNRRAEFEPGGAAGVLVRPRT